MSSTSMCIAAIYGCMMDLRELGQNIDVATLITRLNDTEQLSLAGGADYVIKLSDSAVSSANGIYYINIIKERCHLRPADRDGAADRRGGL